MTRLKVFRTAAGFHDAYVAAPSRKAALAAWGADKDLFARGLAEEVTDPALMKAPLATPGAVVKVSRGGREAQLTALAEEAPVRSKARAAPRSIRPPAPKPSRDALDRAEQALADAATRREAALAEIAREEAELERRKRDLRRSQDREVAALERARAAADACYRAALAD